MASQGNEILTLACGHYSCHLATHFFNIQEASFSYNPNFSTGINHDMSFRENVRRPNSYTPRLVLIDDRSSLGYLSEEGFYKDQHAPSTDELSDPTVILNENKREKNEFVLDYLREKERIKTDAGPCQDFLLKSFYNLDSSVSSWSDYVVTEFDENSIITLPQHTEYYETYENFTCYESGYSLWSRTNLCQDMEEKVRFFLEESDNLQGFQVFTDGGNGYSGISSGIVELLNDEYSKKAILTIPSIYVDLNTTDDVRVRYKKKCDRVYSLASSFSTYSECSSLVTPMSHVYNPWGKDPKARIFPNIQYKSEMMYHSSGILAAAVDLLTLPYRLQESPTSMNNLVSALNIYGRCFSAVGESIPFPVTQSDGSFPPKDQISGRFFESLSPMIDVNPDSIDIQSISSKGLGRNHLDSSKKLDTDKLQTVQNDFKMFIHQLFPRVVSQLSSCRSVFRMPRTFPKVYDNKFNLQQTQHDFGPLSEYIMVGGLHNSREMYKVLNNLHEEAKTIKNRSLPGFRPRDSDLNYEELFEGLKNTSQCYLESSFL